MMTMEKVPARDLAVGDHVLVHLAEDAEDSDYLTDAEDDTTTLAMITAVHPDRCHPGIVDLDMYAEIATRTHEWTWQGCMDPAADELVTRVLL